MKIIIKDDKLIWEESHLEIDLKVVFFYDNIGNVQHIMYANIYSDGKLCLSIKESNDHLFTFLEYIKKEVNIMFNLPESFFEVDFMIYLMIKTIRQNLEHLRFFCIDEIGMNYASSIILPLDPHKHSEAFDVWALYDTEGDLEIFNFNFIYDEDILGSDFENLRQKYKC